MPNADISQASASRWRSMAIDYHIVSAFCYFAGGYLTYIYENCSSSGDEYGES